jgi:DNA invertase Pin-like site-specific DNA recombinase
MIYVSYTRVSTARQGQSGLGLEAQRNAVKQFAKDGEIIAEFTEIETGTSKRKRVEIYKAIELCKKSGATLIIARLDRLARSVSFTASLLDSKVPFIAVDAPYATPLTIHILSAVAESEGKAIAQRVRVSLAVAKERGVILGKPENLTRAAQLKGALRRKEKALEDSNNMRATAFIKLLLNSRVTFQYIADKLNEGGFMTSTGKLHTPCSAWLLAKRAGILETTSLVME